MWARTSLTGNGQYNEAYGYDRMGNIVTRTIGAQALTYTYGVSATLPAPPLPPTLTRRVYLPLALTNWAAGPAYPSAPTATTGQPFAVLSATTGFRAAYDPNGNMTLRVEVSGTQRITYTQEFNVESRLTAVMNTVTGAVTRFAYDGDGNRVLQLLPGGGRTAYVGAVEVSITGTQRITKTYYSLGGQMAAMRVVSPTGNVVYWLHGDHLGSVSLVTNQAQAAAARQMYSPYGTVRWSQGAPPTDIGFTGQRADATGLMFYQARYYAAAPGRFISADTIVPDHRNPQLLNRYSYAGNNPIRYNDPDGHCGPLCWAGIILGLTGVALAVDADTNAQGFLGVGLLFAGLGLQVPEWLVPLACHDGNCTNEAEDAVKTICGGDCGDEITSIGQPVAQNTQQLVSTANNSINRALTQADLGVKGSLETLEGTFSVNQNIATVRVNMIRGNIENPFDILQNLTALAQKSGAHTLRIQATLANERLYNVLVDRYYLITIDGVDYIEILLGGGN